MQCINILSLMRVLLNVWKFIAISFFEILIFIYRNDDSEKEPLEFVTLFAKNEKKAIKSHKRNKYNLVIKFCKGMNSVINSWTFQLWIMEYRDLIHVIFVISTWKQNYEYMHIP